MSRPNTKEVGIEPSSRHVGPDRDKTWQKLKEEYGGEWTPKTEGLVDRRDMRDPEQLGQEYFKSRGIAKPGARRGLCRFQRRRVVAEHFGIPVVSDADVAKNRVFLSTVASRILSEHGVTLKALRDV